MLSKEHLRFADANGHAVPRLLKATPANVELAERILAHWKAGVGQPLGELEDAATAVLHQTRSLLVAKGLQKLVVDACTFRDAASAAELRETALAQSAELLRTPPADFEQHRGVIAAGLGLEGATLSEQLYSDLPDAAVLTAGCAWDADMLLARYNLAQCQGLLLTARELTVTIHDTATGLRRKLLKALRFQRLLADVRPAGGALRLVISGPGTVLDQASRYGLNLALFLPALACAKQWEAEAWITPRRMGSGSPGGAPLRLALSDELGLVGDTQFLGHVPEEIRVFTAELRAKRPQWTVEEAEPIALADGELVVPDLQLRVAGRVVAVELFHRWHSTALTRRLAQLSAGAAPHLLLGVDRAVAKRTEHAGLAEHPLFATRGFLFSEMPTLRALGALLAG